MDLSRVLMLGVVALMMLGFLAITVWVFRVAFQSMRGVAQAIGASPGGPLEELGLTVTSDVVGGVAEGLWRGVAMKVGWRMTAAPYAGDFTPPPEFSTTVVAFFPQPLTLGIAIDEEAGAPPCGIPGLDGRLRLSAALTPQTQSLLTRWAPHLRQVLDAPGRLQIRDEHVAISFVEIVDDKERLTGALEQIAVLHAALICPR